MSNLRIGTEFGSMDMGQDMSNFKTAAGAAKAVHKALAKMCADMGGSPALEMFIKTPAEALEHGLGENWHVCWESGPYEWAIAAADSVRNDHGIWSEPHWAFSLAIYND